MRRALLAVGLAVGSSACAWAAPTMTGGGGSARALRQPVVLTRVFPGKPSHRAIRKIPHVQAMPIPTTWNAVPALIPTRWQVVVIPASAGSGRFRGLRAQE
ncbi:MAG TPA: hypothetical protein PLC79_03800 [Phycisphaerae bacterium]|nr:hypothetical protein [Phycisphaerae bacterium]